MPLGILDSGKLSDLPSERASAPHATITMKPTGRAHLTAVMAEVSGLTFCLHASIHAEPLVPVHVADAVAAFNVDPAIWDQLVADALDAQDQIIEEDRDGLDEQLALSHATRQRLLGATTEG